LDSYILKGDRILLDIVKQNFYDRPIYFSDYSDSTYNLFLFPYFASVGVVGRLTGGVFKDEIDLEAAFSNLHNYNIANIKATEIAKSKDAITVLNYLRSAYYQVAYHLAAHSRYDQAKRLVKEMDEKFAKDKLPFPSAEYEQYFIALRQLVDKGGH
jgi:hypothetical protein